MGAAPPLRDDLDTLDTLVALANSNVVGIDVFGFQDLLDSGGDVLVFAGGQPRTGLHDGGLRPEPPEHLGEFQRYVAAADDDQMRWQHFEFEDGHVDEVVDLVQTQDVGHHRATADVQEDPIAVQLLIADSQGVRIDESGMAAKTVQPSMPSNQTSTPSRSATTMPSLRALTFAMSTITAPVPTPYSLPRRARWTACALATIVLVGMHPELTQVPPISLRSMIVTRWPAAVSSRPAYGGPGLPGADDDRIECSVT